MPFFNFNYITDPPADELVNEQTQLNDNWDKIENNFNWLQNKGVFTVPPNVDLPPGLEFFFTNRFGVWNGTAVRVPTANDAGWGAWNNITLVAPFVALAGFTPQYKINTVTTRVRLRGIIQNTAAGSPFSKVAWNNFGTMPLAQAPINGRSIANCGTSEVTGASPVGSEIAAARIRAEINGAINTQLFVNWMGQDSGAAAGNFVSLDGMDWWYA